MPEQPADPIHYEMKIPPEPDPNKQKGPEKPPSDQNENQSNTARDTGVVRRNDQPQSPPRTAPDIREGERDQNK